MGFIGNDKNVISSSYLFTQLQALYTKIKGLIDGKANSNHTHSNYVKNNACNSITADSNNETYGKAALNICNSTQKSNTIYPGIGFVQSGISDANIVMHDRNFYRKTSTDTNYYKFYDESDATFNGNASSADFSTYSKFMSGWEDTRSVNTKPNDYNTRFEVKGLKLNSAIGNPDNSTFSTVLGCRSWGDSSGGQAHEFALTGNGQVFQRHGSTDSWGKWNRFYTSENITYGTGALTSGVSTLATGNIYIQYE